METLLIKLPSRIQNRIVWDTLEIVKENWLDENLREYRSDIIYRAKISGDDQWVYLLFEHKSAPDKRTHFQLLNLS
ncbi:MAG: Rpn family recombination-promoting nuclease/putative transposase [Fibrobacter sp.]|nr:Rpn family recombination-promoting nuclease/putative transposase [Fibrobacter sp.]